MSPEELRTDVLIDASFVEQLLHPFIKAAAAWQEVGFQGELTHGQADMLRRLGASMLEASQLIAVMLGDEKNQPASQDHMHASPEPPDAP